MKSLYEYLLAEAKDKSDTKIPPGYVEISNRGKMSDVAQSIIKDAGGKLSAKAAAVYSNSGRNQIKKNLGLGDYSGDKHFAKFLGWALSNSKELKQVFEDPTKKGKGAIKKESIEVRLHDGWQDLGGKSNKSSSQRLLKFWLRSLLITYGFIEDDYGFAMQSDLIAIYKK